MRLRWLLLVALASCGSGGGWTTTTEPTPPPCQSIEAFAHALVHVGISFDYDLSESPTTLASSSDVVFAGQLTGNVTRREGNDDEYMNDSVLYQIDVQRVVHGDLAVGGRVHVSMDYNDAASPATDFEKAAVPGIPVVVFAEEVRGRRPGLTVGAEGFATACDDAKPIGRVGTRPAWAEIETLAELIEAADAPAQRIEIQGWHCGIDTVTVDDRRWEVPNDEEPFDGTDRPPSFLGQGRIERLSNDELRYVDDGGGVLRFVPDDGEEPPCA